MFHEKELLSEMAHLRKFALRLTKNVSDTEDLLQSTMLRALEKRHLFQEGTNLFSWSSKIMFNIFACQYRHKKKFESQHDPAPYLEQAVSLPAQEACSDLTTVRDGMKHLSRDLHDILHLVCFQGMLYEEAAAALDIPVGTVRSRLSRARHNLMHILQTPQKPADLPLHLYQRVPVPAVAAYSQAT